MGLAALGVRGTMRTHPDGGRTSDYVGIDPLGCARADAVAVAVTRWLEREEVDRHVAGGVDCAYECHRLASECLLDDRPELILECVREEHASLAQPPMLTHRHEVALGDRERGFEGDEQRAVALVGPRPNASL